MRTRISKSLSNIWNRIREFVVYKILHADDPPYSLAMGIALSMFVTWTPTIGFQMYLVFGLAWLFRANKLVGIPLVWISNPATIVPIYWPCYALGCAMMGLPQKDWAWWDGLRTPPEGTWNTIKFYIDKFYEIAAPLWLGCIVVGGVLGVISYFVTYYVVCWYRMKRWGSLVPPKHHPATDEAAADAAPEGIADKS